jgi:dephospho-CoA kinase
VSFATTRSRIPIIGVTGAIGSGKSSLTRLFSDWGAATISGDEIGHQVIANSVRIRASLSKAFGSDIVTAGGIDRALLARRVFASPKDVLTLNKIVHPMLIRDMKRAIRNALRNAATRAVVIDAALLVEWGIGKIHWDYLIGVEAPYGMRIRRLRARGLTTGQIRRFSAAQMSWRQKRMYCDFIVKNDASMAILRKRARLCWDKLLSSR